MSAFRSPHVPLHPLAIAVVILGGLCTSAAAQDGIPCPAEPTVMPIAFGDAVTCAHQLSSDTDVFTFTGAANEVIVISAFGACMTLTAPGSATVDACDAGALRNRIDAVLTETVSGPTIERTIVVP